MTWSVFLSISLSLEKLLLARSLTLAPMLCARLLKPENGRKYGRIYAMDGATFECMKRGHDASLKWTLKTSGSRCTEVEALASDEVARFNLPVSRSMRVSTRAPRPFQEQDLHLVMESLEPELAVKTRRDNAVSLYRPRNIG
jgi:hypothetical protein